LHICEGAPDLGEEKKQSFNRVIGYLITDFIKASSRNNPSTYFNAASTCPLKHQNNNTIFAKLSLYLIQDI
jgi:hypothetical protein